MKTSKQLERHFKGMANHWRLDILLLVDRLPGTSVEDISEILRGEFATISAHTQKLVQAGLLEKRYKGNHVLHKLSPYGMKMISFIKDF